MFEFFENADKKVLELISVGAKHGFTKYLPFIDDNTAIVLLEYLYENNLHYAACLPFVDDRDLSRFVKDKAKNGDFHLGAFLPFIDDSAVRDVAFASIDGGEKIGDLAQLFPFMDDHDLEKLTKYALERGDGDLEAILPFLDSEFIEKIAKDKLNGKYENLSLDQIYYFLDDDTIEEIFKKRLKIRLRP